MITDKLLSPGPREEGQGPYQGEGRGAGREPGGLPEQRDEPLEEEDEDQGHEYVAKVHCAELSNISRPGLLGQERRGTCDTNSHCWLLTITFTGF